MGRPHIADSITLEVSSTWKLELKYVLKSSDEISEDTGLFLRLLKRPTALYIDFTQPEETAFCKNSDFKKHVCLMTSSRRRKYLAI